jgi:hypothetical protein
MKHQIVITIDTPETTLAERVREEVAGAIEDYIESKRPEFDIRWTDLIEVAGPNDLAAIEAAREEHEDEGTLEIDEGALVSFSSDGGAYVQAWVWVGDDAIKQKGGINPETAGEEGEKK